MKILELTLEASEPLVITSGSAESMAHTCLDYIPGSMLLGAFADAWIARHPGNPDLSPEFQRLFLNGEISWGCAFPLCGREQCVPVPQSYMREKSMAALPVEGLPFDPQKFAVFNPLPLPDDNLEATLRAAWEASFGKSGLPPKFKKLSAAFMNPQTLRLPDLHKVWNSRVALGEQRSALGGQLFGFSALATGTLLRARIYCRTQEAADALERLSAALDQIRAGHARSAGYGLVKLQKEWLAEAGARTQAAREHTIFLLSHYLPDPPWEAPLANLLAAIERFCGQKCEASKTFLAYNQIEGFCSHWRRPRDSRLALAQGGALRLTFAEPAVLPAQFELGAGNLEGYGRILADPRFLDAVRPEIPVMQQAGSKKPQPEAVALTAPYWRILRARAMLRLAQKQALAWLGTENWQKFLDIARDQNQPSASQIANMLVITAEQFEAMLGKTPGTQWKGATASNPFAPGREHLHKIMLGLLRPDKFFAAFPPDVALVLPGGNPNSREEAEFRARSHALFRRELIRTWIRNSRIHQKEGQ